MEEITFSPAIESLKKVILDKYGPIEIHFSWMYGDTYQGVHVGIPMKIRAHDGGNYEELGHLILRRDGQEITRIRLFHMDLNK